MENFDELKYYLALAHVPHIGIKTAKLLLQHFDSAQDIFKARLKDLTHIESMGEIRAKSIRHFSDYTLIEKELKFIEKNKIKALTLHCSEYPQRLLTCIDAPPVLFYKGNANLNKSKVVSIIGTRRNTDYGKEICKELIKHFENDQDMLIVSGLALGIDSCAHKFSVQYHIDTIGILAHGLDTIYPNQNKQLAQQMLDKGGLLTEYYSNTLPDKENFPTRNRIVAGMTDVLVVIETETKGGSMITANLADGYNKDIAAFPGRTFDTMSSGCNHLIKQHKAHLITNADDLCRLMNWTQESISSKSFSPQRQLFIDLSEHEHILYQLILQKNEIHIDEIMLKSNLTSSQIAGALLNLELQNIIMVLPGKRYKLA